MRKHLSDFLPEDTLGSFHEPFLGGGSLFFSIAPEGISYLSDLNKDLIETYRSVRDDVETVIMHLGNYTNSEECYYSVREEIPDSASERAARFIFLNQTSFNGIYRVNLMGEYNVPYGYRNKDFLDADNLLAVSERLLEVKLDCSDFDIVRDRAKPGDFVFLDPPYTVSHNSNGFIKYNQKLFSLHDQRRLRDLLVHLDENGVRYALTNAAHSTIAELFEVGNQRLEYSRISRIGGKNARRGRFSEYVFTNVRLN